MVIFTFPFLIFLATTGLIIPVIISLVLHLRGCPSEQSLPRLSVEKTQGVVLAAPPSQNGMPTSRWQELGRNIDKLGLPLRRRFCPVVAASRVAPANAGCRLLLEADDATSGAEVSQHPRDAAAGGLMPQLGVLVAAEEDGIAKLPQPTGIFCLPHASAGAGSEPVSCHVALRTIECLLHDAPQPGEILLAIWHLKGRPAYSRRARRLPGDARCCPDGVIASRQVVHKVWSNLLDARPDEAVEEQPILLLSQGHRALPPALLVVEPREKHIDRSWPLVREHGVRDLVDRDLFDLLSHLYGHASVNGLGEKEAWLGRDVYV
ncbi:hypothetical protein BFJ67_g16177 [Fusarium oxysporum f. sp. cepae]|nr:hypothetical protein BFJ67_g16177 [Fusarium oxysporum f. sp. cepae]